MKKLLLALLLGASLLLIVGALLSAAAPPAPLRTLNSGQHFLPPYPNPRDRFGFDSLRNDPLTNYDVAQLDAAWYSDWGASLNPPHPDGLTFVQLIRFKAGSDPHDPAQVTVSPNRTTIAQIAAAHPGSLWMVNNEPDSLYQGNPIYPDVYAHVYHEYYYYIKRLDPTALIANGGIVQPTPCRMMYLDIVWNTYQQSYSETMPVDVWNIHAFILREVYGSWGASTPPGVPTSCAMDYTVPDSLDIDIFRQNLIAFRQWMKDKGEQNKPLIISEYGVLWPNWFLDDYVPNPTVRVSHFMTQTFDLFLNETYPDVGYPEDDYRLVQAWAWYSLSDDQQYNGYLFYSGNKRISPMGQTYADYTAALTDTPYADLTVQLWLDSEALAHISPAASYDVLTVTLPATGAVANLGKLPVNILISAPLLDYQSTLSVPARYEQNVGTLALPSLVLTRSGLYDLSFVADPAQVIADPRRWNNAVTITVEARPDLAMTGTTWSVQPSGTLSNVLHITLTVANEGVWPTPPVSGTLYLSSVQGSLLLVSQPFPIPAIGSGVQVTITEKVTLPSPIGDPYRITIEADSDDAVNEQDENNNRVEFEADLRPDLVISTTTWSIQPSGTLSGMLSITLTVANAGTVSTPSVSGTLYLSNTSGSLLLPAHRFPIPAIAAGDQVTIRQEIVLPVLNEDFYRLALKVDSDGILNEQNENNNRVEMLIPIVITVTLEPGAASVLTAASGHITFQFLTGTVATSTELCFMPLWLPELPPGPLLAIEAFRLTTCQGQPPVSPTLLLPVTVTWQYTDMDVVGLDEDKLGLYHGRESNHWQRISCPAEQRWTDENRLSTCIQQLGEYVFGYTHKLYLPLVLLNSGGSGSAISSETQPATQSAEWSEPAISPGLPVRLPPWAIPPVSR